MPNNAKIHWGRVLVAGFLAELLVFAVVFPVRHLFGQQPFLVSILMASAGRGRNGRWRGRCAPNDRGGDIRILEVGRAA